MQRSLFILISAICILIQAAKSQADYTLTNYTAKNGLPQNSVKSLEIDSSGYLWLTTEGGVARFDGKRFSIFDSRNTPFLVTNRFISIERDWQNNMYVNDAHRGLYKLEYNRIELVNKGDRFNYRFILMKGAMPSLNFYKRIVIDNSDRVSDWGWLEQPAYILTKSDSHFYVSGKIGLIEYRDTSIIKTHYYQSFTPTYFFLLNTSIYCCTKDGYIYFFDEAKGKFKLCLINNQPKLEFLPSDFFYYYKSSLAIIRSERKLFKIKQHDFPNQLRVDAVNLTLPDNTRINDVEYSDANHFFAVGTDTKGLLIYKEKQFKSIIYPTPEEGTNNAYYCQMVYDSNTVYTNWQRFFTANGGTKSSLPLFDLHSNLYKDKNQYIWYRHNQKSFIYHIPSGSKRQLPFSPNEAPMVFYEEGDTMWIANKKGIGYSINYDSIKYVYQADWTIENLIPLQLLKINNQLWMSNCNGLLTYDIANGKTQYIRELQDQCVRNITLADSMLLVGTYGNGYYVMLHNKLFRIPVDENNFLSHAHSFLIDKKKSLWITTNNGLFKTTISQLANYCNDTTQIISYHYYGEEDGILNTEFNGGVMQNTVRLPNGYVSLSSMDGLVWFVPEQTSAPVQNNPLQLDKVILNHKEEIKTLKGMPAGVENIQFVFSSPYWGNSANQQIEYRLLPFGRKWIRLEEGNLAISFNNLRSKSYTLELRKIADIYSNRYMTLSIPFSITPHFYESNWFAVLMAIMAMGVIVLGVKIYTKNIENQNRLLEKNVAARTLELSTANSELIKMVTVKDKLISIISHEIVTPLKFMSLVARTGMRDTTSDNQQLVSALNDIQNTSEKLHENSQNILNWMKHQHKNIVVSKSNVSVAAMIDTVSEALSGMINANQTEIINEASYDDLIITDPHLLNIILRNLITNAVKFTIGKPIQITTQKKGEHYFIQIKDKGKGMNQVQLSRLRDVIANKNIPLENPMEGAGGNGLGYVIIAELIELIGARITIESQPGQGTTATIDITQP
ncbi:MAG: hypothetical protein IPO27_04385 [Bacteroidetes bacterium]|nr:hypothetical protein [Bacteroidota bacterium]